MVAAASNYGHYAAGPASRHEQPVSSAQPWQQYSWSILATPSPLPVHSLLGSRHRGLRSSSSPFAIMIVKPSGASCFGPQIPQFFR